MRILHVVPTYLPAVRYGGPILSVHGLCKSLVKLGHEVHVCTTNVDGDSNSNVPLHEPVNLDGVLVHYFPSGIGRRLYYSKPLSDFLKKSIQDYDLVHLHSVFLWPTWCAARVAKSYNIKYLLSPRGMLIKDLFKRRNQLIKSLWINFIEKKTINQCAAIHVTSDVEALEFKKFKLSVPKLFNIPNGIDIPSLNAEKNETNKFSKYSPYVLFVGRINWKKGLELLIQSWVTIKDVNLVIAGNDEENYQRKLETLVNKLNMTNRIHFTGYLDNKNKMDAYRNAELFVLPSHSENFGNVVLEAMSMECPVIVTENVGLAPEIKKSNSGLVIDNNPVTLAENINNLISKPDTRKKMGINGRQVLLDRYSWPIIAKQMEQCYQSLIVNKN